MANQITVNSGTGNITITTSRSVIGTVANVLTANYANYAGNANVANTAGTVTTNAQPNITSVGTLGNLTVSNTITTKDLTITGNLQVGNLVANTANYANFAGVANVANVANSVALANVSGAGNIAAVNLTGSNSNVLYGNGVFAPVIATLSGDGGNISNIQGANVSGAVGLATYATTANSVAGANVTGAVANATYANIAGTANSVSGANVSGSVANATYANISGVAYSVSGSNVSGTVANAAYADNAGNANTANSATVAASANSVAVANVSGIGNIATINLNGNALSLLDGTGNWTAIPSTANANYANYAGNAFSVDGANVVGTVANATYADNAGNANTANLATYATTANSVAGANVNGEVANANFASYANVANSANSVAVANVSGIGNIATVNLNGNASTLLDGTGNWTAIPSTANANYANFAGDVVNSAQPNITSVGNLVSATINANVANSTTIQVDGTLITTANGNFYQVVDGYDDGNGAVGQTSTVKTLHGYQGFGTWEDKFYANDGTGNAYAGFTSFDYNDVIGNSSTDPLVASSYQIQVFNTNTDFSNPSTTTGTNFNIGVPGIGLTVGTQTNQPLININQYTDVGLRFNVRSGNSDARANVVAGTSLGNIEWRPAGRNGSGAVAYNTKVAAIGAKVDSAYTGANAETVPTGLELTVVNASNTQVTHSYYANGDISFAGAISATNLGNVSTLNLDGNASNILYGNGVFAASPSVTLTGDGGNLSNINGANVSGQVSSANVANFVYVSNVNSNSASSFNIPFITGGSANGNYELFLDGTNGYNYNPNVGRLTANLFSGSGANLTNLPGANVTGTVPNANVANLVNVSNANAGTSGTFYPVFVATTGNGALQLDNVGNTISYNPSTGVLTYNTAKVDKVGNDNNGENIEFDGTNNSIRTSVTGLANATVVSNASVNVNTNLNVTGIETVGNNAANTVTTKLDPVGANIATLSGDIYVHNVRTSNEDGDYLANDGTTRDAVVLQYDLGNGTGQFYDVNYLARDVSNVSNIASAVTQQVQLLGYNSGDAAAASAYNLYIYTNDSDLANANPNTTLDVNYGGAGLFINQKMPNGNNAPAGAGIIGVMNYGESGNPQSATGLRFQRRRGNNSGISSTRLPVQANDYLSNIAWRGAGTATGGVNSGTVTFGAKVDSSYGGPGNVMPIGMEMTVINSSNSAVTHSFYANGDVNLSGAISATNLGNIANTNFNGNGSSVLLGNGVFGTAPAGIAIENGNSKVDFTGTSGDLRIKIDGNSWATFNSGRTLQLDGVSGDSSNASKVVLFNGGMQVVNEDLGGGFPSFEFKSYYTTGGGIAPYVFQRARGTYLAPANTQSGDAIMNQSFQAYSGSGFTQCGTFSATVANNDNAGNVVTNIELATANNNDGSKVKITSDIVELSANSEIKLSGPTVQQAGTLFAFSAYTASALTAITGSLGQVAAVQDQGGKLAYWDTANSRWSYVYDNSAV